VQVSGTGGTETVPFAAEHHPAASYSGAGGWTAGAGPGTPDPADCPHTTKRAKVGER